MGCGNGVGLRRGYEGVTAQERQVPAQIVRLASPGRGDLHRWVKRCDGVWEWGRVTEGL